MLDDALGLPPRPESLADRAVAAWSAPLVLPTYRPQAPDRYPAYLNRRVYQGSSGRVFPLPFCDRISETPIDHEWVALHLENEYVRVTVLPELGGRIHYAIDLRTGYPLFYANPVIKPALVGLTGPWLAGGIEFNWPQHHRPATFLPTAWEIDETSGIVWCSDHDPFARMKGMHGIRLQPGSTVIELLARLYNRTDETQTFLWWANVAAEVHDDYQSFFPPDVTVVADHAKRALSTFPAATSPYYGIDYPSRAGLDTRAGSAFTVPGDRLDWQRNIPVPTSYMALGSRQDFFGGYDHRADAGFVHWADHHYAVGKKQWTWGNADFGRAWSANLTDNGSSYIELMAGVFTDNQPDFSYLAPGETKTFSQHWYPIAGTGPAVAATLDVALGVTVDASSTTVHVDATRDLGPVELLVTDGDGRVLHRDTAQLSPRDRWAVDVDSADPLQIELRSGDTTVLSWRTPTKPTPSADADVRAAREPAAPEAVASVEELYLTGQHLEQYRHATRSPEPYWAEALARDAGHAPTHTALGARRFRTARYAEAEQHLRAAIERLTQLNPNPRVGEAHYLLGLTLLRLGRRDEAYDVFAKATWLDGWVAAGNHQLAILDAFAQRNEQALLRAAAALRARPDHHQVRNLQVVLLRRLGRGAEAEAVLAETLAVDPLDVWARSLADTLNPDAGHTEAQTLIDVALESARIGEHHAALQLLAQAREADRHRPLGQTACGVIADYLAAVVFEALHDSQQAADSRARARVGERTWNFAVRLDDVDALEAALAADPDDPTAAALLGHWQYAHQRADDAVRNWQRSAAADGTDSVVWRNLAVAAFNHAGDVGAAQTAYERALTLAPDDAKLTFEYDQLLKRIGTPTEIRLARLERRRDLTAQRDDLSVEYAQLLVNVDRPVDALAVLASRRFQPWEGGEGQVLRAWERTQLALLRQTVDDPTAALRHARAAIDSPPTLGEARQPLANPARLLLSLGDALQAAGRVDEATAAWQAAASATGDFTDMSPRAYSDNTYFSVLAARRLGDTGAADQLDAGLSAYTAELATTRGGIDYFATSLPALMLFDDDPQRRQDVQVELLRAQLALLADDEASARRHLDAVLAADPSHELALDLQHSLQPSSSSTPYTVTHVGWPTAEKVVMPAGADPRTGVVITNRGLLRDGKRWIPISGEIHYTRLDRRQWRLALQLMKAGGITVVSSYVFWNHHQPDADTAPDFTGNRDVAAFLRLCAEEGLAVVIRIGPWAHGEARNGGFPDWVQHSGTRTRTDDPGYLALVREYWQHLAAQIVSFCGSDGPIVAVQLENELYDNPAHIATLKALAQELGIHAPVWTATGWGNAQLPLPEVFPVFSGYSEGFWVDAGEQWDSSFRSHFFFSDVWDDPGVGKDLAGDAWTGVVGAKHPDLPPATCELGAGMATAYHRRPVPSALDVTAVANVKLGSGSVWQGYYMYVGGTNPDGPEGLQESHATGYPNDLPRFHYDFHAPLGRDLRTRESFHRYRLQHAFLDAFGARLAEMTATLPQPPEAARTLRWSLRSDGTSGYLYVNNHQPVEPLTAVPDVQFDVRLDHDRIVFPPTPVEIPGSAVLALPVALTLAGVTIRWATVNLITRLDADEPILVAHAHPGLTPQLAVPADHRIVGADHRRTGAERIAALVPGREAVTLEAPDGARLHLIVLDPDEALHTWTPTVDGTRRLVLSPADIIERDGRLVAMAEDTATVAVFDAADRSWGEQSVPGGGVSSVRVDLLRSAPDGHPPPRSFGGRASAPSLSEIDDVSALYRVIIGPIPSDVERAVLHVDLVGDVATLSFADDDELMDDLFWDGTPWTVDVTRFAGAGEVSLDIHLTAFNPNLSIRLTPEADKIRRYHSPTAAVSGADLRLTHATTLA